MDKEKSYLGDPPEKPRPTEEQMVALRKSIVDALIPVVQAIPGAVSQAMGGVVERLIESQPKMITAGEIGAEMAKLRLPAPQVTIEQPKGDHRAILTPESVQAIQKGFQTEAREYVDRMAEVLEKNGSDDFKALAAAMKDNPEMYLNVRLSNGQKFIDALKESFVVGMGSADSAKNATLQSILTRLDGTLTVSGILSLSSDIQIGAVEIKDGLTDQRAEVGPDRALKTAPIQHNVTVSGIAGTVTVSGTMGRESTQLDILTELLQKTEPGNEQRVAGNVTISGNVTVSGMQNGWATLRANYTAAQTNAVFLAAATGERIIIKKATVTADNANSVDVGVRLGYHASTTPATDGCFISHPGIAKGSGVGEWFGTDGLQAPLLGDDILITSEVPTGGSIDVVVVYKKVLT